MPEPVRLVASLEGPAGAPVLVLGNSLGTTRAVWEPQTALLRRHFQLLRYEHRGHGGSPAPPGPYTIGELGGDVLALLDAYEVDRALYCGISLGGMVGLWLAANEPERIAALGLCCTSAYLPPAGAWLARAEQVRSGALPEVARQVVGRWFTPAFGAREPAMPAAFAALLEATRRGPSSHGWQQPKPGSARPRRTRRHCCRCSSTCAMPTSTQSPPRSERGECLRTWVI
jgi:3-oxoadipate enol-lactonase